MAETVGKLMIPIARSIRADSLLADARKMMTELGVSVLPVRESGELQGVVTVHDLDRLENKTDQDTARLTVEDAMSGAFEVGADEPAEDVARHMVKERWSAAIVKRNEALLGVYSLAQARELLGMTAPVRRNGAPAPAAKAPAKPAPPAPAPKKAPAKAGKKAAKPAARKSPGRGAGKAGARKGR